LPPAALLFEAPPAIFWALATIDLNEQIVGTGDPSDCGNLRGGRRRPDPNGAAAERWRIALAGLCGGAAVLFAYGLTVNIPAWEMSWLVFHQPPSLATIIGLIVAGGIVLGAANA
jgi:hypothetical protein